jgi:hypothetical protein
VIVLYVETLLNVSVEDACCTTIPLSLERGVLNMLLKRRGKMVSTLREREVSLA